MKAGDLVKYLSRVLLVIGTEKNLVPITPNSPDEWVLAVEVGETRVGKYRRWALKVIE